MLVAVPSKLGSFEEHELRLPLYTNIQEVSSGGLKCMKGHFSRF
jgi:hypothetical protein